jgi:hypothetical protein
MYLKQGSIRDVWADSGDSVGVASLRSEGVALGGFFLGGWSAPGERKGWGGGAWAGAGCLGVQKRMPWNVDPQCQNAAQGLFSFFFPSLA